MQPSCSWTTTSPRPHRRLHCRCCGSRGNLLLPLTGLAFTCFPVGLSLAVSSNQALMMVSYFSRPDNLSFSSHRDDPLEPHPCTAIRLRSNKNPKAMRLSWLSRREQRYVAASRYGVPYCRSTQIREPRSSVPSCLPQPALSHHRLGICDVWEGDKTQNNLLTCP